MPSTRRRLRPVIVVLSSAALVYVAACALMWAVQDRMVFPGAGYGDRGVPDVRPPAVVGWLGQGESRTRIATLSPQNPRAVALYLGGNGEDLHLAVGSAAQLVSFGVEAIACEYPGYGASPGRPSVQGVLAAAQLAAAHARERAQALGVPFVVVGSSLGSFAAMHVGATGAVDRLVLRAPPTSLAAVSAASFPWLPVRLLLAHRFDNLGPAATVRCPVVVLHGDRDRIVSDRFGREVAAALPQARFVSVPGRGHNDIDLSANGPVATELRLAFERP